jgi:hypothetical protein
MYGFLSVVHDPHGWGDEENQVMLDQAGRIQANE